jgi:hypothetical protein
MGKFMDANPDFVFNATDGARETLVDNQKASEQGISKARRGLDWTGILARNGLETPGYHEVIAQMKKENRIKNQ